MSAIDRGLEPAIADAIADMRRLEQALHRGVGDRDKSVRGRVSRLTGVPASYLLRLHKRAGAMTDMSAKWARLLRLACERLDAAAERANQRAEEADRERLAIAEPTPEPVVVPEPPRPPAGADLAIRQELARRADQTRRRGAQAALFEDHDIGPRGLF